MERSVALAPSDKGPTGAVAALRAKRAGMATIALSFPGIYEKCLAIAYREADDRLTKDALNTALVEAADALYLRITGEAVNRQ